jgi:separase
MERTHSQQELTDLLKSVEKYCWSVLTDLGNRGSVAHHRKVILILVFSIATKTNLGDVTDDDADMAVTLLGVGCHPEIYLIDSHLLDWAAAETLRRELLESIEQKLQIKGVDDMEWPVITQSNHQKSDPTRGAPAFASSIFGDPDGSDIVEAAAHTYWATIRDRHKDLSLEAAIKSSQVNPLPDNWTIVNIGVSEKEDSLFIARRRPNQRPLLFCIPLKRASRNEMDTAADELTIDSAINEMNDIVESSRQSGKRAGEVAAKGRESRAEWWSERAALDQRLCDLLENIEFCWLGAFKVPGPALASTEAKQFSSPFFHHNESLKRTICPAYTTNFTTSLLRSLIRTKRKGLCPLISTEI